MPESTAKKGNRKKSKKDQPKRKRYILTGRRDINAIRSLQKHLKKHPEDQQAIEKLKALGVRG